MGGTPEDEAAFYTLLARAHRSSEARKRRVTDLPTRPYLGLSRAAARDRAEAEGRFVEELEEVDRLKPVQADFAYERLRIVIDSEGTVIEATAG